MYGNQTYNDENPLFLPEYVNNLNQRLMKIHDFAGNKFQLTSNRIKVKFEQRAKPTNFVEGDSVCAL